MLEVLGEANLVDGGHDGRYLQFARSKHDERSEECDDGR